MRGRRRGEGTPPYGYLWGLRRGGGSAPPVRHALHPPKKCHCEERSDVAIRSPYVVLCGGVRIATPVCALVRNDTGFWGCGACRRRGEEARCGRVVGEIGEAPPVAEEASRFRGSAPIGGHDSGRESVGTTVGNRRPLRIFCSFSVGRHPCVPPYRCFSAQSGVPHPVVRTPPRRRPRYTFPRTFAALR